MLVRSTVLALDIASLGLLLMSILGVFDSMSCWRWLYRPCRKPVASWEMVYNPKDGGLHFLFLRVLPSISIRYRLANLCYECRFIIQVPSFDVSAFSPRVILALDMCLLLFYSLFYGSSSANYKSHYASPCRATFLGHFGRQRQCTPF